MSRFNIVERTLRICKDVTAQVVTGDGRAVEVDGIFDNAEIDFEQKREGSNGAGGLKYKARQPVFTTGDQRVAGIDKTWQLTIKGVAYFCPEPYADGAGWVTLWLVPWVGPAPAGEAGGPEDGAAWR